jgi:DNA-binding transcriptional LysR family regulator
MAQGGAGIAALPDFLIREHLACGALVTVLDQETERTGTLSVPWAANRFRTPEVRALRRLSPWLVTGRARDFVMVSAVE